MPPFLNRELTRQSQVLMQLFISVGLIHGLIDYMLTPPSSRRGSGRFFRSSEMYRLWIPLQCSSRIRDVDHYALHRWQSQRRNQCLITIPECLYQYWVSRPQYIHDPDSFLAHSVRQHSRSHDNIEGSLGFRSRRRSSFLTLDCSGKLLQSILHLLILAISLTSARYRSVTTHP